MEPRTLFYMTQAANGQRLSGAPEDLVYRVCTDSRLAQAGDLFVALRGDRFDGHAFLDEVASQGTVAALVERSALPAKRPACGLVVVENTRAALGAIAACYRREFSLPLIAVGGSNGKTTTKDMIAAVLRQKFRTLWSRASFNNDIGVPSTLLELSREHEVAVLELGTNHPGELAPLLEMTQPQYGVMTSIGREHLEFFGDLHGVVQEEGCLAEALPRHGKLFLNGDTPSAPEIAQRSSAPVVTVGQAQGNTWRARAILMDDAGVSFQVEGPVGPFCRQFRVPLLGRHQAINGLLAIALGVELGLAPEQVQLGLAECLPAKMRLQLWKLGDVQVLDDCYNANADSMRVALETLSELSCRGRRIAVLGDMAELGLNSSAAHAEIGHYLVSMQVDHLVTVGTMASLIAQAARASGLNSVEEFSEVEAAAQALRRYLRPHDVVLLKASRAAGLERIGEWLRGAGQKAANNNNVIQPCDSLAE